MTLDSHPKLTILIEKCIKGSRRAHNELYETAFPYAMSIAMRFGKDRDQSLEIVNMAFHKIFLYLKNYDVELSFKSWIRKIVVHSAIDHFQENRRFFASVVLLSDYEQFPEPTDDNVLEKFDAEQILFHIQSLPPAYRMVFSLFAIEGYSHKEIAEKLEISEGTSKSNYFKARSRLMEALTRSNSSVPKAVNA